MTVRLSFAHKKIFFNYIYLQFLVMETL